MHGKLTWTDKMAFHCETEGHTLVIDAKSPLGNGSGPTPKSLLTLAVGGCTGMDVVALLKKYKQPLESLEIDVDAPILEKSQPAVFKNMEVLFNFKGQLEKEKVIEAVRLSQTKYCGVTAMLLKSTPITYVINLNGEEISRGEAHFA